MTVFQFRITVFQFRTATFLYKLFMPQTDISKYSTLVRYFILQSTTAAGSGHPTSSLSAADVMTVLMVNGYFKADLGDPQNPNNDRLIFSKGHASPLFYALYALLGKIEYS